MAKFVSDIKTLHWLIIAPLRQKRPSDQEEGKNKICPFCLGNEFLTPPEIFRLEGKKGWRLRVVPNLYPITKIHEVIIHSPSHFADISQLPEEQIVSLLEVYRVRFLANQKKGWVVIFSNHGDAAGASLAHPHSQLVVVPKEIPLKTLTKEPVKNLVEEDEFFFAYCPEFSQWPYEVWMAPKKEGKTFGEITAGEIQSLAKILPRVIRRLEIIGQKFLPKRKEFAYNYYFYHGQNWFLRLIPRFIFRAGFELGTGLSVNIVDPVQAAQEIRRARFSEDKK